MIIESCKLYNYTSLVHLYSVFSASQQCIVNSSGEWKYFKEVESSEKNTNSAANGAC